MTTPTNNDRDRIYDHVTKSRFLHIEDALNIGKIRLFCGEYKKGEGMGKNTSHFLDVEDARVLFNDLSWNKTVKYTEFKGTANGEVTSRVFSANSKEDKVWFELKTGPGKETETGAIQPAGEPTIDISIALTKEEARRLALAVLAYIQAAETACAVWKLYNQDHPKN